MAWDRRGAATAAPATAAPAAAPGRAVPAAALLVLAYLLLEGLPALTGRTGWAPLTRPPVLEPVRLLALVLLEAVMPVAVLAGVLVLLRRTAGRDGGRLLRLRATGVLVGAVGSAELLKWLLPAVRPGGDVPVLPGHGSFPSGHTATAVALALLLAAVRPARPATAGPSGPGPGIGPGIAWSVAVATLTVVAQWHRPADAIGGALLAAAWFRALFPGQAGTAGITGTAGTRPVRSADAGRLLGWWLLAAVPAVLAVAAAWWSVPAPVHRVLPHLAATALLAVAVGLVTRWAAPGPAAPPG